MSKIKIELSTEDFISIIHGAAKSSCWFDKETDSELWHLHCCDYGEPIVNILKQINLNEIKDRDYRKYAKSILRTYESEYKELLEDAKN